MAGISSLGNVQIIANVASLQGLSAAGLPPLVYLQGSVTPLDGGQGFYAVNLTDKTTPDNGTTVIVDTSGYRWELISMDTAAQIIAALSLNGTRPALDPILGGIVSIAAAATVDLSTVTQAAVNVTGAGATIASLGTVTAGPIRILVFDGINTLDYDATALILPGGANITTAAGDVACFLSLGAGNWRCLWYQEASGGTPGTLPVAEGGTGRATLTANAILTGNETSPVGLLVPGAGVSTFLATPSSANLLAALTDKTGTGLAVFAISPALTTPNIGAATATSVTFSNTATGGIVGTTTNDNAAAGYVGEYLTSTIVSGSAIPLSTGTTINVTSLALTAGDWDVVGAVHFNAVAATVLAYAYGGVSSTSATVSTSPGRYTTLGPYPAAYSPGTAAPLTAVVTRNRFTLAAPATVYLVALAGFTVDTLAAFGTISARRVR